MKVMHLFAAVISLYQPKKGMENVYMLFQTYFGMAKGCLFWLEEIPLYL